MESYIAAPDVHAEATKNPQFRGGPFIDYNVERSDEIKELIEETKISCADLIALSSAIEICDAVLQQTATGASLEPIYSVVPDILKGLIELVYDLHHRPSVRFIEPLLYRTPLYKRPLQSIMLSTLSGDDRPFILSTPRLDDKKSVMWKVSFDQDAVDELFSSTTRPRRFGHILDVLNVEAPLVSVVQQFVTEAPPPKYVTPDPGVLRWRYFGHACILIETNSVSVLVDPVLSYTYEQCISRYTYQDIPPFVDYVLITHNHQDHILLETLLQIRHKIGTVVVPRNRGGCLQDPSLRHMLEATGFKRVCEVDTYDRIYMAPGDEITCGPFLGEHGDLDIASKCSYHIRLCGRNIMLVSDSCVLERRLYEAVGRDLGQVDTLFIWMECARAPVSWIYGPSFCT